MLASSVTRVTENTAEQVNEQIRRRMEETIARFAAAGLAALAQELLREGEHA